jgi:hypothetical protein
MFFDEMTKLHRWDLKRELLFPIERISLDVYLYEKENSKSFLLFSIVGFVAVVVVVQQFDRRNK